VLAFHMQLWTGQLGYYIEIEISILYLEVQRRTVGGKASGKKAYSSGLVKRRILPCTASVSRSKNSRNVKALPSEL
jgi:hypothetical protein